MSAEAAEAICTIRPAVPDDVAFIADTWLEGYRHGSPWANRLTNQVFYSHHHPVVHALLARASVLAAVDSEDPQVIRGYVVWEPETPEGPALHWIYVSKAWRRLGIAARLLAATGLPPDLAGVNVTHPTFLWFATRRVGADGEVAVPGRAGLEEMFPGAVHNPYLGFGLPSRPLPEGA